MKKIGPCKILRKFDANAYEIELLDGVGISPIFNVSDLYPYMNDDTKGSEDHKKIQWEKQMMIAEKPQMEKIVVQGIGKKTRRKTYFEYLIIWKGHPIEYASWENELVIHKHGTLVQELMERSPIIFVKRSMMQEHHWQSRGAGPLSHGNLHDTSTLVVIVPEIS
jgi:hypothetical protein